ncbi:MAG: nicotinate-nucleotide adenylyltransferase [Eggerthellaceae bacterium]|nr:nicotinate-nucleotide adenylyltransferase [Eggerthellaceae bacterium]MDR2715970.1 nicotinate-nucleotide adenylyltransferase [Coriobacteriaceae bacterium]
MARICGRFDRLGLDDPGRTCRLGIMGGTFDPIHIGHLACAEQVRENFGLDAVVFIPAGVPVYKKHLEVTPAHHRLEMCRLACESNPFFDVSSLEIDRGGDTYTVDTLRELRAHYPDNVELSFITGADAVLSIIKWHESSEIARLARLIAATRPGYVLSDGQKADLRLHADFSITYTEITALAISSSDLRLRIREGKSLRYLAMQCVSDYIGREGLYQEAAHE